MGCATAELEFDLQGIPDKETVLRRLLSELYADFIEPKAVVVYGLACMSPPWTVSLAGSIETDPFGEPYDRELFPGEYEVPATGLTALRSPERWIPIASNGQRVTDALLGILGKPGRIDGTTVAVYAWGLTHVYHLDAQGLLARDWFLRERLGWGDGGYSYHRLIETRFWFADQPVPEFNLWVHYKARLWSEYTDPPLGDIGNDWAWPTKADLRAVEANCDILADRLAGFLTGFPDAELTWVDDSAHSPFINTRLVRKLAERIGPPENPWALDRRQTRTSDAGGFHERNNDA
jgi:hypothetical protein